MTRAPLVVVSIIAAFVLECGGGMPTSEKAFILTDRATIGFDQLFGNATYICTSKTESLSVFNAGQEDLHISDITLSGPSTFRMMTVGTPPITVKGMQRTYLQVTFTPRQPMLFTGSIAICSDADNTSTIVDAGSCPMASHHPLTVGVSGLAYPLPDGGQACNCPDGGGAC